MNYLDEEQFSKYAIGPSYAKPVVVMFSTQTCAPCAVMKPLIERLASELSFPLFGINAVEEKGLVRFYDIRSVPTIAVFKENKVISTLVGKKTEEQIKDFLFKAGVTQNTLPGF